MTRILYNPENGSAIKNVMYKDELLFSKNNDEVFEPGMVVQVEEDVFMFLRGDDDRPGLFGFLEEMEPEEAKKYLATSKERLKCKQEGCAFGTRLQSRLDIHMRDHKKELLTSELGIPLVGSAKRNPANLSEIDKVKQREKAWDDQDKHFGDGYSGLDQGAGLQQDRPRPDVIMS